MGVLVTYLPGHHINQRTAVYSTFFGGENPLPGDRFSYCVWCHPQLWHVKEDSQNKKGTVKKYSLQPHQSCLAHSVTYPVNPVGTGCDDSLSSDIGTFGWATKG